MGNATGLYSVDLQTRSVTTLARLPQFTLTVNHVFARRDLSTQRAGPSSHVLEVSFGLGNFFRPYAVAMSLSGVRPGVVLPDGRRIPLNIDWLTQASVTGALHPILFGTTGKLVRFGRARAVIHLPNLPAPLGLRVWAVAIVFDPAAPLGIATISAPVVMTL